jgi:2-iminobutanoate/2-iminopropanoate deaminase
MPNTFGPYTPIRQSGGLFFVSGQVGVKLGTKSAGEDIAAQTNTAIDNLAAVLASAHLTLDDVVKTTVFLTNMNDFAAMNESYTKRFNTPRPARSTVGVAELPRVSDTPLLVEIEAVAAGSKS